MNDFTHLVIRNVDDRYDSPVFMVPYEEKPQTTGPRYRMTLERFDRMASLPEEVFEVGFMSVHQATRYFPEVVESTVAKRDLPESFKLPAWVENSIANTSPVAKPQGKKYEAPQRFRTDSWKDQATLDPRSGMSVLREELGIPAPPMSEISRTRKLQEEFIEAYKELMDPDPDTMEHGDDVEQDLAVAEARQVEEARLRRHTSHGKWVQKKADDGYEVYFVNGNGTRQRTSKGHVSYVFPSWGRALIYANFRAERPGFNNQIIIEQLFPDLTKVYRNARTYL